MQSEFLRVLGQRKVLLSHTVAALMPPTYVSFPKMSFQYDEFDLLI